MIYTTEVQHMCPVAKGAYHGPAPIPEEGKWVQAKQIADISGFTHGIGWCAPQQGACKLTLNVKEGVIQEALIETIGCSGMTHSAAMASEILIGKTILEALNTDLVCDAINTRMRQYGKSVTKRQRHKKTVDFWGKMDKIVKQMNNYKNELYTKGGQPNVHRTGNRVCRDSYHPAFGYVFAAALCAASAAQKRDDDAGLFVPCV